MIVDWMEAKMKNMATHERICSLVLDEVQISTGIQYDSGFKKFIGMIDDKFHPSSSSFFLFKSNDLNQAIKIKKIRFF